MKLCYSSSMALQPHLLSLWSEYWGWRRMFPIAVFNYSSSDNAVATPRSFSSTNLFALRNILFRSGSIVVCSTPCNTRFAIVFSKSYSRGFCENGIYLLVLAKILFLFPSSRSLCDKRVCSYISAISSMSVRAFISSSLWACDAWRQACSGRLLKISIVTFNECDTVL